MKAKRRHAWLVLPAMAALLWVATPAPTDAGSGIRITIKRIKKYRSEFPQWKKHKVRHNDIYMGIYSKPKKHKVEYIVFIAAGQQGFAGNGKGKPNGLTGQPDKWRKRCGKRCTRTVSGNSLFARILRTGRMPRSKTLYVLVFNADFNFGTRKKRKTRLEKAYFDYLTQNAYSYRVRAIYMAGSSRGGALTARLAARFKNNRSWRNRPLILQQMDSTFRPGHDMGLSKNPKCIQNPLTRDRKYCGFDARTALNHKFGCTRRLSIYHIVGGQKFITNKVHGYTGCSRYARSCDVGWYRQNWVKLTHEQIGRDSHRAHFSWATNFFVAKFDEYRRRYKPVCY